MNWYEQLLQAGVAYPYFAAAEAALMADQVDAMGRLIRRKSAT